MWKAAGHHSPYGFGPSVGARRPAQRSRFKERFLERIRHQFSGRRGSGLLLPICVRRSRRHSSACEDQFVGERSVPRASGDRIVTRVAFGISVSRFALDPKGASIRLCDLASLLGVVRSGISLRAWATSETVEIFRLYIRTVGVLGRISQRELRRAEESIPESTGDRVEGAGDYSTNGEGLAT
jgi:hypothetical protein